MKNQRKYQKGITLIALVITIIVLLILAGVTLSIVFNGGIIEKSQNAVDKYSQAQQNETELLDYIDKKFGQSMGIALDNINGRKNEKLIEQTDNIKKYCNPIIPVGFKTVNTETASWEVVEDETLGKIVKGWNEGLVIEDSQGNQFVWVPVDGTKVKYEKWTSSKNGNPTATNTNNDDILNKTINEMTQINIYEGFYIARYESGIPSSLTEALTDTSKRNASGIPVSKKNQIPWNYIDYTTSKANAESMYSSNYVKSGLVTGTQWDTLMLWLKNSDIEVETNSKDWGNYRNSPVSEITSYSPYENPYENNGVNWTPANSIVKPTGDTASATNSWLLKTGNTKYTSNKNIYDLAGNLWEYSNEIYSSNSNSVIRGGSYYDKAEVGAAHRSSSSNSSNFNIGFRCVLYVQ